MANEILTNEVLHFTIANLVECFGLYPLGEVVYNYEYVNSLAGGCRKFPHYIHSPFHEGPRRKDGAESFSKKMRHLSEALAAITTSHVVCGIQAYGGPVVTY